MGLVDKVCLYSFYTYFLAIFLLGIFAWLEDVAEGNISSIDQYEGRAEMYLDFMHE